MIDIKLKPGKYVLAVSGGVDSVTLLNLLSKLPKVDITIAHFDHGIRTKSELDRKLVEKLAAQYKLPFKYANGNLRKATSEATAREARYKFLHQVRHQVKAQALITAHHQDDVLETAILNWLRGTGRRGLSSLRSTDIIKRPLLDVTKEELVNYAHLNKLYWAEDATNKDEKYLRNYVRKQIIAKLSPSERSKLLNIIKRSLLSNQVIDKDLDSLINLHAKASQLDRQWFLGLSHSVSREIMLTWLRQHGIYQLDRRQLEQIVIIAKTHQPGKRFDINKKYHLKIKLNHLALEPRDR